MLINWYLFFIKSTKYITYPKIASLSALKARNAMNWPGGAAISFCVGFTIDLCCVLLVCAFESVPMQKQWRIF